MVCVCFLPLQLLQAVSGDKRCAFTEKLDLDRVKELKVKLKGATLNDVMITLLTLTFKAYYEEAGDAAVLEKKARVRVQFPISYRGRKEEAFRNDDAHNKFGYGFMDLFVRHEVREEKQDRIALTWRIKRKLDAIKFSPSPMVQIKIAGSMLPYMPLRAFNKLVMRAANKATAQLSNVAGTSSFLMAFVPFLLRSHANLFSRVVIRTTTGPQGQSSFAGVPITNMDFILASPLSLYVGLLTYKYVHVHLPLLEFTASPERN